MVEWKKMWEVTTWDKKFSGVEKYMQPKVIKYYYYLANELADLERLSGDIRILYTTNKEAYTNSIDVEGTISEGEVVTIPWGGNVNIQYYNGKFVTADNRIATSNNTDYLNNKFLYYWMLSQKDEIAKMYRGAGIQHPSMLSVLSIRADAQ
jgi:type I restriction enzyme S subunit